MQEKGTPDRISSFRLRSIGVLICPATAFQSHQIPRAKALGKVVVQIRKDERVCNGRNSSHGNNKGIGTIWQRKQQVIVAIVLQ